MTLLLGSIRVTNVLMFPSWCVYVLSKYTVVGFRDVGSDESSTSLKGMTKRCHPSQAPISSQLQSPANESLITSLFHPTVSALFQTLILSSDMYGNSFLSSFVPLVSATYPLPPLPEYTLHFAAKVIILKQI